MHCFVTSAFNILVSFKIVMNIARNITTHACWGTFQADYEISTLVDSFILTQWVVALSNAPSVLNSEVYMYCSVCVCVCVSECARVSVIVGTPESCPNH